MNDDARWYLRTQDETFGPETKAKLVEWARLGRIQPGQEISDDNVQWLRVEDVPFLDMRFSIDIGDGNPRGPFNRAAAEALLASGRLPPTATIVETRAPFPPDEPQPAEPPRDVTAECDDRPAAGPEPQVVEKIVVKEVPVEKIVEKIVEKVVIDETRVKELEGLLEEERRHTADLQSKLDESSRNAAEAAKAATLCKNELEGDVRARDERIAKLEAALRDDADRENKYVEQVKSLEDELRRLPQAASEVADIQAAVFSIITGEAADLEKTIDEERREFEEIRRRFAARAERLTERRRGLLKRSGSNIEEMTRKALVERPEDPRTAQLRKELEELRRTHENSMLDNEEKIKALNERLRQQRAQEARLAEGMKDVTQLHQEAQLLRERLQVREAELLAERQRNEELVRQQAAKQQVLLARLASLESPSIGPANTMSTNQSREAKQVKLPGWMHFK